MAPTIRLAGADDAELLALVGCCTFLETYAGQISGADILAHCARRHSASIYLEWIADPLNRIWLAEAPGGASIGYLVLTPATLPDVSPHPRDMEVQRIYVLSRFHKAGVGHRLMQEAVDAASAAGIRQLVLGVLKTNARAVAFYERQGFSVIDTRKFVVGSAIFDDLVMGRVC